MTFSRKTNPFHNVGSCKLAKHSIVLDNIPITCVIGELFIIGGGPKIQFAMLFRNGIQPQF